MAHAQAHKTNGGTGRWKILFITDLHGLLDGFRQGAQDRYGGLGLISHLVRITRLRYKGDLTPEETFNHVAVCLGGDMVRRHTHRLLHQDSAQGIWDNLMELLRPDAVVFGNHELSDFGNAFVRHVAENTGNSGHRCGCTRNMEWEDSGSRPDPGETCQTSPETWVPCCSIHRYERRSKRDPTKLLFVGLVDWDKRDEERVKTRKVASYAPYRIRPAAQTAAEVLVPYCFHEGHEPSRDRIVLLLAHYGGWNELRDLKLGACSAEVFGRLWRQGHQKVTGEVTAENRRTPHFILKGHDHERSPGRHGQIRMRRRWDWMRETGRGPQWIPSFSGGADGEGFGMLDLQLQGGDRIDFNWEFRETNAPALRWKVPNPVPLAAREDWVWKGVTYEVFGRNERNSAMLAYSMDLLLRSLSHRSDRTGVARLTLASPESVLRHSEVPEYLSPYWGVGLDDVRYLLTPNDEALMAMGESEELIVRRAWTKKIDGFELRCVYGGDEWLTFACTMSVAELTSSLWKAFSTRRAGGPFLPTALPLCADRDDPLNEQVTEDGFPFAQSLWMMAAGEILVVARPPKTAGERASRPVRAYRLGYDPGAPRPKNRFWLSIFSRQSPELSERVLGEWVGGAVKVDMWMPEFAARLLHRPIAGASGGKAAGGFPPVYCAVQDYLDACRAGQAAPALVLASPGDLLA